MTEYGIVGLQTRKVSPPHTGELVFVLRTALSPYECEKAASMFGFGFMGQIGEAVGEDRLAGIMEAIRGGKTPEQILAEQEEEGAEGPALPPGAVEVAQQGSAEPDDDEGGGKAVLDPRVERRKKSRARAGYDLDWAATKLIKSWNLRTADGKRKLPIKVKWVRMLDRETREWLHDMAWEAMLPNLEPAAEGN